MKIAQNGKKCAILFGFNNVRARVCVLRNGMYIYKIAQI